MTEHDNLSHESSEQNIPQERTKRFGSIALTGSEATIDGYLRVDAAILHELEPTVQVNIDRHMKAATDWMPHEYIPWALGRNYTRLGGEAYDESQSELSTAAAAAWWVNLLTEDNLPSYNTEIGRFSDDGPWAHWVGRWTAEEARHGVAMRDFLVVTRGVDPVALELARMGHMTKGYISQNAEGQKRSILETLVYVSFQEMATRISHRNTGTQSNNHYAEDLLARIAIDENLHMVFYRNLVAEAFKVEPDATMQAIYQELVNFSMPGDTIPNFKKSAALIARANIYGPTQHYENVVMPVLKYWKIKDISNLSPTGEIARQKIYEHLNDLEQASNKFIETQERIRLRKELLQQ